MRRSFERRLQEHNRIAQLVLENPREIPTETLDSIVQTELENISHEVGTTPEAQRSIQILQQSKQEVMRELRNQLRALEHSQEDERIPEERFVSFEDDKLVVHQKDHRTQITLGVLLTDGEWGTSYVLDAKSVPRNIRKQYFVREAKRRLWSILQAQIILEERELGGTHERKDKKFQDGLQGKKTQNIKRIFSKVGQEGRMELPGMLTQRSVRNFLEKALIDAKVPFEIEDADVFHDVMDMLDFVIRTKSRVIEFSQLPIGIQFTVLNESKTKSREILTEKRQRLQRRKTDICERNKLHDLLLVNVFDDFQFYDQEWMKDGKPPGGPDRYWPERLKEQVIFEVLGTVLSRRKLEEVKKAVMSSEGKLEETHALAKGHSAESAETEEEVSTPEREFGTSEYQLSDALIQSLHKLSDDSGKDLLQLFQERLDGLVRAGRRIHSFLLLQTMNETLQSCELTGLSVENQTGLPYWLKAVAKPLRNLEARAKKAQFASMLFPRRAEQQSVPK